MPALCLVGTVGNREMCDVYVLVAIKLTQMKQRKVNKWYTMCQCIIHWFAPDLRNQTLGVEPRILKAKVVLMIS